MEKNLAQITLCEFLGPPSWEATSLFAQCQGRYTMNKAGGNLALSELPHSWGWGETDNRQ